jgi:cell division septation protein DedD
LEDTQDEPRKPASRTVQKAVAGSQLRPLLIGAAVVAVLFVAIVVAGRYDRMASKASSPKPEVTAGRIQVEGTEVLPAKGPASRKEPADSGLPVQFYQVLGEGKEGAAPGGEIELRALPLPPPANGQEATREAAQEGDKKAAPARKTPTGAKLTARSTLGETPPAAAKPSEAPAQAKEAAPSPQAEAPVAKAVPPATDKAAAADRPYTLQVGSFSERAGADELAERLKGRGFAAYLLEVDLGDKGVWWRVRVGRYPTEYSAKWARLDLVKEGLSPIVVRDRATP